MSDSGWSLGGQYGLIGVEICDSSGNALAVVNRVQANRLQSLNEVRSASARRGEAAHQAEHEAQGLETSLPQAIARATLMAAAPDLLAACKAEEEAQAKHARCKCHDYFSRCLECRKRLEKAAGLRRSAIAKAEVRS